MFGDGEVTVSRVFAGTLYSDLVQIMSDDGTLSIEGNIIQMFDNAGTLRLNAGYNKNLGRYVFELYNSDGARNGIPRRRGQSHDPRIFKTGEDNEARIEIDQNGIQSFDSNNRQDGLIVNPNSGYWTNLSMYLQGHELFKVELEPYAWTMLCNGGRIIIADSQGGDLRGTWKYNQSELANAGRYCRAIE